jgi:hypothetical protein
MPHWISDWIQSVINVGPALFVDKDDAHFILARAMFALLFIVLPSRSAIARHLG